MATFLPASALPLSSMGAWQRSRRGPPRSCSRAPAQGRRAARNGWMTCWDPPDGSLCCCVAAGFACSPARWDGFPTLGLRGSRGRSCGRVCAHPSTGRTAFPRLPVCQSRPSAMAGRGPGGSPARRRVPQSCGSPGAAAVAAAVRSLGILVGNPDADGLGRPRPTTTRRTIPMSISRREFVRLMGLAGAAGMLPGSAFAATPSSPAISTRCPSSAIVTLLHITDTHAQLNPDLFPRAQRQSRRGAGPRAKPPHLVGKALLKHFGITTRRPSRPTPSPYLELRRGSPDLFGKVGGFAHLKTLVEAHSRRARRRQLACCWTAATPGRGPVLPSGPVAWTWWGPATCSASMS